MRKVNMIEIDGSYGEGGGQIIRTALTLSAITQKAVKISDIRAGRPNPGLQMQHLTCAKAVRNVCRGSLEKAELGSTELLFNPGKRVGGKYDFNIGTAGSVTLVAQTIIPILLLSSKKSTMTITGGTHVMKSPGYDYFENVFIPAVRRFGADIESRMLKVGYYPKGGGVIEVKMGPSELRGCADWTSDEEIRAIIRISGLPMSIAIREKKIFVQEDLYRIAIREDESLSVGNAVTAWKGLRGSYVIGEKGKRAETVAKEALDAVKAENRDVDMHLADQLLLYAALAEGQTSYRTSRITGHMKTNMYIVGKFIGRDIKEDEGMIRVS